MKKLVFLLLMAAALAGFVFADDTAYPPGVLTLEAAMYGDSADVCAVTPYTVLAALPVTVELTSFQAVMALYIYDETAIQPQYSWDIPITNTGQSGVETCDEETKFDLRC